MKSSVRSQPILAERRAEELRVHAELLGSATSQKMRATTPGSTTDSWMATA